VQFREIREIRPEKTWFTEYALRSSILRISGEIRTFSDIFSEMSQIYQKNAKKNAKKHTQNWPETHQKFSVFCKNRLWRFVKGMKNGRKNDKIQSCTLFKIFRRAFQGFQDFQLRIEVKIGKKRAFFRRVLKIFVFSFYRLEVDAFCMGRKSELRFFYRVWNIFGFGSDFVLFYSKIRPDKRNNASDYPIGPCCAGGSVPFFLFRFRLASRQTVNYFAVLLWGWK
jgi:hypothetical protein